MLPCYTIRAVRQRLYDESDTPLYTRLPWIEPAHAIYTLLVHLGFGSGCTTEFANAAQVFAAARYVCNKGAPEQRAAYPEKFLYYSRGQRGQKENYCESDVMLQALTGNDAVKLRAFFYAVNACNQYYTGYG